MFVETAAITGIVSAVGVSATGITVAWRYTEPGALWFTAYTTLVGAGLGLLSISILTGLVPVTDFTGPVGNWLALVWIVPASLWAVFVFNYTGRFLPLGPKTAVLLGIPVLALFSQFVLSGSAVIPQEILGLFGLAIRYYALAIVIGGIVLMVRDTHQYSHVPVWQGVTLAVAPAMMWLFWNSMPYVAQLGPPAGAATYVLGSLGAAGGFGLAVFRFDAFNVAPAVGVVGERDIVDETDDLVVVADNEHRVVRANESVRAVSDGIDPAAGTVTVEDMLGDDVDGLRAAETVSIGVAGDSAKYDPQVSTVTDRRDRQLGTVISLREVTQRELRKERLSVLNRVLRHNLRNELDILNAHLEAIDDDHGDTASKTVDRIARIGDRTRKVDQLLSETRENVSVDVAELLRDTAAVYDASITMEATDSCLITTDRVALEAAVTSAVDNAVTHAANVAIVLQPTPEGCAVEISDDGPGIPESELAALETGTETSLRHGTGLGLWQLTWAARTLGGDVSFDTSDGTTVTISVPDSSHADT